MKRNLKLAALLLIFALCLGCLSACTERDAAAALDTASQLIDILSDEGESAPAGDESAAPSTDAAAEIDRAGSYTGKDEVALYIHTYGCLPENFVTKDEARDAGWSGGSLEPYLPGMSIGGDRFGNREGLLPDAQGRQWTECDIDTMGASSRGAKRIVFSNDGLVYYTGDHYESFQLLYD